MKGNAGWKVYWTIALIIGVSLGISTGTSLTFIAIVALAIIIAALAVFGRMLFGPPPQQAPMQRPVVTTRARAPGPPPGYVSPWLKADEKNALFEGVDRSTIPVVLRDNGRGYYLTDPRSGKQMPFDNTRMPRVELWGVNVRGSDHYRPAWSNMPQGATVELVHEPDNPHDPNAVAIQYQGRTIGYYNRGMAKRLARRGIDGLEAYVLGITREDTPRVLAAPADVWDQIGRPA